MNRQTSPSPIRSRTGIAVLLGVLLVGCMTIICVISVAVFLLYPNIATFELFQATASRYPIAAQDTPFSSGTPQLKPLATNPPPPTIVRPITLSPTLFPTPGSQPPTSEVIRFHFLRMETKASTKQGFKQLTIYVVPENVSNQWTVAQLANAQLVTDQGYTYNAAGVSLTLDRIPPGLSFFGFYRGNSEMPSYSQVVFDVGQELTPKELRISAAVWDHGSLVRLPDEVVNLKQPEPTFSFNVARTKTKIWDVGNKIDVAYPTSGSPPRDTGRGTFSVTAVRGNLEFDYEFTSTDPAYDEPFACSFAMFDSRGVLLSYDLLDYQSVSSCGRAVVGPRQSVKRTFKLVKLPNAGDHWYLIANIYDPYVNYPPALLETNFAIIRLK